MGFLNDFVKGMKDSRLERLCAELGWGVDERIDDKTFGLHFNGDRLTPKRVVYVIDGDGMASFLCKCRAQFSSRTLPDDLLPAMLVRNVDVTVGAWQASVDSGGVSLLLRYNALTAGMDAATFQRICTMMLREVAEVEAGLSGKGLL
jgi:hypothetical protein